MQWNIISICVYQDTYISIIEYWMKVSSGESIKLEKYHISLVQILRTHRAIHTIFMNKQIRVKVYSTCMRITSTNFKTIYIWVGKEGLDLCQ